MVEKMVETMSLLKENFNHLQYIGLWCPVKWSSNSWKSRVYRIYTISIIGALYWFGVTESISLFTIVDSVEDFSDSSFMLLTAIVVCVKVDMILMKKSEIIALITTLEGHPHKPINTDEEVILDEFIGRIRLISWIYGGVVEASVWAMTISVFFQDIPYGDLPYKAWIPYNYSTPIFYWLTFCLQLLVVIFVANVACGFDTALLGFFMLVCAQFNILRDRLEKAVGELETAIVKSHEDIFGAMEICERRIVDCVKYHRAIFEYVG
ncbi:uncharacterized protein [Fopius arisanus]|uniref:Odorant receptor n=1 Tax=Fopius arisanus TaxID=64838 RepID=A0A9R1TLA6_9HYME|nr:PREDICTED: uncharacterized protein LOC105271434 [Fopius arisanus]